jgi:hypothetical protein
MKKQYITPEIDVVEFETLDDICSSIGSEDSTDDSQKEVDTGGYAD